MVLISAFADEISSDLDTQLNVLSSEGIQYLEFRGVWNKNVLRLSDEELSVIKGRLEEEGIRVSCIGSPIGKIKITDEFESHIKDFERVIHVSKMMDTKYIRIFSFYGPEGQNVEEYRDEVIKRMNVLVRRAERNNVVLLHENERHIYGESPQRCLDILQSCASPSLRLAFDPANFVQSSVHPMMDAFPVLESFVEYVHIKDAHFQDGRVAPAGEGDGDVTGLIHELKGRHYKGFLSIEPHLKWSKDYSHLDGPDAFRVAARALKSVLEKNQVPWN